MENDEIKTLLQENLKIVKENNRLLGKMRRSAIYGNIARIIWWAIILGLPVVLYYYFLQPYIGQLGEVYSGAQDGINQFQNLFDKLPFIGGGESSVVEGAKSAE